MTLPRNRRGRRAFALLIGIAMLAAAALPGGSASGAGATSSAAKRVDIDHFAFHPPTLRLARGGRVTFANSSDVTHTASSGSFDTHRIRPGKTRVVQFNQKGVFAYHCKIHPFMKGKIVVE